MMSMAHRHFGLWEDDIRRNLLTAAVAVETS